MPAIDNNLVRKQAAELAEHFAYADEFVRQLRKILEQHADPSYRQSLIVAIRAPLNGFGTPRPVLRTVLNALRKRLLADPQRGFALAERLWQSGSREERWLAGEVLSLCMPARQDDALATVETWLLDLADGDMADALALSAGGMLLGLAPRERLNDVRLWLHSGHRWARRFGLVALIALGRDRRFSDVAAMLDVAKIAMSEADPEVRTAAAWLMRELSTLSSPDVVRFLREWAGSLNRHAHWIVRHSLDKLDNDARHEIQVLLRSSG